MATVTSFDSKGFSINRIGNFGIGQLMATMSINGVVAEVGQFTKSTSTGDDASTSIGIASDAYILSSGYTTTDDVETDDAVFAFGAASELIEAAFAAWTDQDGQDVSVVHAIDVTEAITTAVGGENIPFEEIDPSDGTELAIGGAKDMDIGAASWIDWETNTGAAIKINYIGFTGAGNGFVESASVSTSANTSQQIVVGIASENTGEVIGVTWNNNSFIKSAFSADTTTYSLEFWSLDVPTGQESTGSVVRVTTDIAGIDLIFGIWIIDDCTTSPLQTAGSFSGNDVDDYYTAGVTFNQPTPSSGTQIQAIRDIEITMSVDDSGKILDNSGAGATYTNTTLTDGASNPDPYTGRTVNGDVAKSIISAGNSILQITSNSATVATGAGNWQGDGGTPSATDAWYFSGTSFGSGEVPNFDVYETAMHAIGSYIDDPHHKWQAHYYFEESIADDDQYMYVSRGRPVDEDDVAPNISDPPVFVNKISMRNSDFGQDLGIWEFPDLTFPGQVARYQGSWYLPYGGTKSARQLTVGTGTVEADTLSGLTDAGGNTAEHIANRAHQLFGSRAGEGVRILINDGDPTSEADWGQYFSVGDKSERAAGLASVDGADFVMNQDGLWSFISDDNGDPLGTALVFEDFRIWKSLFPNVPISPWKGGLLIPHPSGLLFWIPGQQPTNIGFDSRAVSFGDPPVNVTDFKKGRYLGVVGVGDYIYAIYQPDITLSQVHIMCGYLFSGSSRTSELIWQSLGVSNLYEPDYSANVGVTLLSKPLSTEFETPVLWYNNGNNIMHKYLDSRAGPFRVGRTTQSGFILLSELFFPDSETLTEMVIYTQGMRDGDSWQLSLVNDGLTETNMGSPIITSGKNVIKIDRHNVYRAMFKLTWSTSNEEESTVTPSIRRMELYGEVDDRN